MRLSLAFWPMFICEILAAFGWERAWGWYLRLERWAG